MPRRRGQIAGWVLGGLVILALLALVTAAAVYLSAGFAEAYAGPPPAAADGGR